MAELVDKELLRSFVPTSSLHSNNFKELSEKSIIEKVPAGATIFKSGDTDRKTIYLLSGQISVTSKTGKILEITSGTPVARHPIANFQPRKHTAVAKTHCKITRIESKLLDTLMTRDQVYRTASHGQRDSNDNNNDNDDDDWMTRILQSTVLTQVPPCNIQAMFMRLEEVPKKAGDAIIKQGEKGDYYYIIKRGRCKVTRDSKTGAPITLATLTNGDSFGEEALLSDSKRNANVIMDNAGTLLRLSKKDFEELLKTPMLHWVTRKEADELAENGAVWIDVRLKSEHEHDGIEDSINIPLMLLRIKCPALSPDKKYIVYCDTGSRSSAATFLLTERGLDAVCLKGGLSGN